MAHQIKDGTGSGRLVHVNNENKLMTLSVTETIAANHAFQGEAYNINTGTINLTSDSKSALLYVKNNEDEPLIITALFYLIGNSDVSGSDTLIQVERNPTGGTIISDANTQEPINRDFGSNRTLTVDSYKGAEGKTMTGGAIAIESLISGIGRQTVSVGAIVLRKGNSIGVTVTPQTNNTSQDFQIALSVYRAQQTSLKEGI